MVLNSCANENFKGKAITHARHLMSIDCLLRLMMDLITIECGFNPLVSCCTDFED